MKIKITKKTLKNKRFSFNAMAFTPKEQSETKKNGALFTHGYTASKSDCLNWAQRLVDNNIPTVIFDLPGHYLGSFNEVDSFSDFSEHAHECFEDAFSLLQDLIKTPCKSLILGGHSLGALLSIKALNLKSFEAFEKTAIAVGLGISDHKTTHLFESSFYQKTLELRRQLVSSTIDSDYVFPWIKEQKSNMVIRDKKIHLICGKDDVVVGQNGAKRMYDRLKELGNDVSLDEPSKLPHHEPERAATHIHSFLKQEILKK